MLASPEDKNTHFLCIQPFFLRPAPPNFRLSLQYTHTLQSVATHPRHVPHLFFVVAAVGNEMIIIPMSAFMHVYICVFTLKWHLLLLLGLKCGTVRGTCVCVFLKSYMYIPCLQLFP